ncbi:MAG: nicotinate-nucleotide--dimethylbenzimidazole phosphoribosyltransferase [Acidobacteria bacterium]|nr:nicotinate-nucleotide--dimethylbenzimidazole phosphoribosyltransferase [Acidobacteriota bacterium]
MTTNGVTAARTRVFVSELVARVRPVSDHWRREGALRLDRLTKPPGSLGGLEEIALRCCAIQETLDLTTSPRRILVCAGDHGVVAEGVSAYPKAVTAQMVANITSGGAAINALAAAAGADVWIVDVGVDGPTAVDGGHARLVSRRVRNGTRNMLEEAAMSEVEMLDALQVGLDLSAQAAADGVRLVGLGEMGIGNTTAASAVTAGVTGRPPARVTGRGTGVDDGTLARKVAVVERAVAAHGCVPGAPLDVLRTVGGLEIAALCGVCLGAAAHRLAIVTDGFVATSAALIAAALAPSLVGYLFAGHLSPEPGHAVQLEHLGLRPLLNLNMRLGEGTGAALAMPVIGAAALAFTSMATFDSAGVSGQA